MSESTSMYQTFFAPPTYEPETPDSRPASHIDDQGVIVSDFDTCGRSHTFIVWVNRSAGCELKRIEAVSRSARTSRDVTQLLPDDLLEELRMQAEDYWRGDGWADRADEDLEFGGES